MKVLLLISLLLSSALPLGTTGAARIEKIVYQIVPYGDTPIFDITFANSGNVTLTLANTKTSKDINLNVENGKTYKVEGPSFISSSNMQVTIKEKESNQSFNITIEPGLSKSYKFDTYNAKNGKTSISDVISMTSSSTSRTVTKYSLNHATILNASRVQNRIFDLKRYSIDTTNLDETYIKEAYLTSTNNDLFDDVFCKSGICKVPLEVNYSADKLTFELDHNYCYSNCLDKVDKCSSISDAIPISNLILNKKAIGLTGQQMDLVIDIAHGNESKFTYQLKNMSFAKGIYGACSTSSICIESVEPLENITYQKEVIYP